MRKDLNVNASQRLERLLPWLNDPLNIYATSATLLRKWEMRGRRAVAQFLVSFDGSPAAGHVEVLRSRHAPKVARKRMARQSRLDPDALETLQVELQAVLEAGYSGARFDAGSMPLPSLRFGARNANRGNLKVSTMKRRERRAYTAPGAYVLHVAGTTHDLTLFLVLHLLTVENMAGVLSRCPAPAPYDWKARCDRWFLRTGHGQKRKSCSDACRVRWSEERKATVFKGVNRRQAR